MGIQGLAKLIGDSSPSAVKTGDIKSYFGKDKRVLIVGSLSVISSSVTSHSQAGKLPSTLL